MYESPHRNIRNLTDGLQNTERSVLDAMKTEIDVALILWNSDVIELVSFALDQENLRSCGAEPSAGLAAIEQMIQYRNPSVVVFDLDPPYDRSAATLLRLLKRFPSRFFVVTCADKALAVKKAPWLSGHPMFQKPYGMDEVADVVGSLVRRVPQSVAMSSAAL